MTDPSASQLIGSIPRARSVASRRRSLVVLLMVTVVAPMLLFTLSMMAYGASHTRLRQQMLESYAEQHPSTRHAIDRYLQEARGMMWVVLGVGALTTLAAAFAAGRYAQHLARNIQGLQRAARVIAGGNLDSPIRASGTSEIGSLAQCLEQMREGLNSRLALQVEERRLARELEVAQTARALFMTKSDRCVADGVDIQWRGDGEAGPGGTSWHIARPSDGSVVVLCARASAEGIAAAMLAVAVEASVRVLEKLPEPDVGWLMHAVHDAVTQSDAPDGELAVDAVHIAPGGAGAEYFSAGGRGGTLRAGCDRSALGGGGARLGARTFSLYRQMLPANDNVAVQLGPRDDGVSSEADIEYALQIRLRPGTEAA